VASYSLGQLIASPTFGKMANCLNRSREPLVVSLIINILANILYAYLEDIKNNRVVLLIVARALIGFGAGWHIFYFFYRYFHSPSQFELL
jgi:ceroid-lipofuscinosis MFS transporter 7